MLGNQLWLETAVALKWNFNWQFTKLAFKSLDAQALPTSASNQIQLLLPLPDTNLFQPTQTQPH
ncbi:MAG: hypothetical protein ACJARW_000795 [Methylophilaceae bacterium]|jgi:hypothetical protein